MTAGPLVARRPLRAVVTAGGTEEPIDDVRVLTNVSSGRFGAAIARALVRLGVETTVLASRRLASADADLGRACRLVPFRSVDDLGAALEALALDPPDLLFMAAAVSDYRAPTTAGKLSSEGEVLALRLTRAPKLLATLRAALGPRAVLIGFKLLSGVPAEELVRVARAQARGASLDLTVANDLAELGGDAHPVWVVPPEGDAERLEGHRQDVADELARRAVARADGRGEATLPPLGEALGRALDALGFPRDGRAVRVRSGGDPALLLDAIEGLDALVMVDDALGRFDAELACEDATSDEAVRAALAEAARAGRWSGGAFAVGIEGGGAVLGLDARAPGRMERDLGACLDALAREREPLPDALRAGLRPVLEGGRVVGLALTTASGAVAPWIHPASRRRDVGDAVARALADRGARVACRPDDAAFFQERGFHAASPAPLGLVELDPPGTEIVRAASVLLVDPLRRRVLLGRRRAPPWEGFFACPGGKLEDGEAALEAARRELAEETGIRLASELSPRLSTVVLTSDGARVFQIENLAFFVLDARAPRPTAELEARWVDLAEARALRPMAAGTRRVLARVEGLLARGAC